MPFICKLATPEPTTQTLISNFIVLCWALALWATLPLPSSPPGQLADYQSPLKFLKLASPKPAESAFPTPSILSQENHNEGSCLSTFPLAPSTSHQPWCFPVWPCVGCCGSSFWGTTINYLFHGNCLLLCEPHPYLNNNEIYILNITPASWDPSAWWDPFASCTSW